MFSKIFMQPHPPQQKNTECFPARRCACYSFDAGKKNIFLTEYFPCTTLRVQIFRRREKWQHIPDKPKTPSLPPKNRTMAQPSQARITVPYFGQPLSGEKGKNRSNPGMHECGSWASRVYVAHYALPFRIRRPPPPAPAPAPTTPCLFYSCSLVR